MKIAMILPTKLNMAGAVNHPSLLDLSKMKTLMTTTGRKSSIETLRDKEGKKWLTFMGPYDAFSPLNMSRSALFLAN